MPRMDISLLLRFFRFEKAKLGFLFKFLVFSDYFFFFFFAYNGLKCKPLSSKNSETANARYLGTVATLMMDAVFFMAINPLFHT